MCRQWSKRVLALNQHKNHEPIISRKLEIRNNQPQDFSRGTASRARASQDQHAATHDLAPKNYEEQERPRITLSAYHARCRTVIWRKTIDNIKRDHLTSYVPEVLVVLWERRRGSSRTWKRHWTSALIAAETETLEAHAVIAPVELVHGRVEEDGTKDWTTDKGKMADKEDANKGWKAIKDGKTYWNKGWKVTKDETKHWNEGRKAIKDETKHSNEGWKAIKDGTTHWNEGWKVIKDRTTQWNEGWKETKNEKTNWNEGWKAIKDGTTHWNESNTAQTRRRNKVRNSRNSTLDIILAVRETTNFRVENTSLITKGRLGADKRIGSSKERNDTQPNKIVICKEKNPKVQKLGLLLHIRKNLKAIGRELRGIRSGYESFESEPKKRIEPQTEAVRESGTKETGRWKSEGERNQESKKKKVATLREETVTVERFLGKKSNETIGERTRRTTKTRVRTKNSSSTEEGVPRNRRVHRTKITVSLHRTKTIVKASKTIHERNRRTTKARRGKKNRNNTKRSEPTNLSVNRTKATVSASKTTDERSGRTTKTREVRKS